jgi:cutinase
VKLVLTAAALVSAAALVNAPPAAAVPCPEVEVLFARGTDEPPGIGVIGQSFLDALRADTDRTVGAYAVNYPASTDYPTAAGGVIDADRHIRLIAANCPGTEMVLGGYSQGAGVMALLASQGSAADSAAMPGLPVPLPPELADRIAAVVLFGKPSAQLLASLNMPQFDIGPTLAAKTIDLCVDGDPICSSGQQGSIVPHLLYGVNGMVSQAADFAARRL